MAGYSIQKYPNEPIVLVTYLENWNTAQDYVPLMTEIVKFMDTLDQSVFYVVDVSIEPKFNLQDLMMLTKELTQGGNPVLKHRNMREHLVVTRNGAMKLATKGLNSPNLGKIPSRAFESLDEALAYARSTIAMEQQVENAV